MCQLGARKLAEPLGPVEPQLLAAPRPFRSDLGQLGDRPSALGRRFELGQFVEQCTGPVGELHAILGRGLLGQPDEPALDESRPLVEISCPLACEVVEDVADARFEPLRFSGEPFGLALGRLAPFCRLGRRFRGFALCRLRRPHPRRRCRAVRRLGAFERLGRDNRFELGDPRQDLALDRRPLRRGNPGRQRPRLRSLDLGQPSPKATQFLGRRRRRDRGSDRREPFGDFRLEEPPRVARPKALIERPQEPVPRVRDAVFLLFERVRKLGRASFDLIECPEDRLGHHPAGDLALGAKVAQRADRQPEPVGDQRRDRRHVFEHGPQFVAPPPAAREPRRQLPKPGRGFLRGLPAEPPEQRECLAHPRDFGRGQPEVPAGGREPLDDLCRVSDAYAKPVGRLGHELEGYRVAGREPQPRAQELGLLGRLGDLPREARQRQATDGRGDRPDRRCQATKQRRGIHPERAVERGGPFPARLAGGPLDFAFRAL